MVKQPGWATWPGGRSARSARARRRRSRPRRSRRGVGRVRRDLPGGRRPGSGSRPTRSTTASRASRPPRRRRARRVDARRRRPWGSAENTARSTAGRSARPRARRPTAATRSPMRESPGSSSDRSHGPPWPRLPVPATNPANSSKPHEPQSLRTTPARCGNAAATGSPARLSETHGRDLDRRGVRRAAAAARRRRSPSRPAPVPAPATGCRAVDAARSESARRLAWARPERLEHHVRQRRGVGAGVDRGDSQLLLDQPGADPVVGRRAGHRHRVDAVAVAQDLHPAPGGDRVVGGEHHGAEGARTARRRGSRRRRRRRGGRRRARPRGRRARSRRGA